MNKKLLMAILVLLVYTILAYAQEPEFDHWVFTPMVQKSYIIVPTSTPPRPTPTLSLPTEPPPTEPPRPTFGLTPTCTPTETPGPIATLVPTPTLTPTLTIANWEVNDG